MNNLKTTLTSLVLGSVLTLGITPEAKAHYSDYAPNHAHVCTVSTNLNIRSKPNGKIVGSVNKGYQVQIKGSYNNWETNEVWYEIYMPNSDLTGYVSSNYICF